MKINIGLNFKYRHVTYFILVNYLTCFLTAGIKIAITNKWIAVAKNYLKDTGYFILKDSKNFVVKLPFLKSSFFISCK
jgi:hypothetical protein